MNNIRTYIAGPMRHHKKYNFPAFDEMRDRLLAIGYDPVSPADIDRKHGFDPASLPEDHDWSSMPDGLELGEIITRDIEAVRSCAAYVLLDGWEKSIGATAEKGVLDWQGSKQIHIAEAEEMYELRGRINLWAKNCLVAEDNSRKPTNPKDIVGSEKLPLHLWPETATAVGCLAMLDGALKYGRSNFRAIGVRASIYVDAVKRHINRWFEGQDNDADSGLPHLSHALACIAIIVDAVACGQLNDDRMVKGGYENLIGDLTPHVKRLKEKYADKNPKHWTIKDKV